MALALATKFDRVYGFDISEKRVEELRLGKDRTREVTEKELRELKLRLTTRAEDLKDVSFFIVTVPDSD